MPPLLTAAIISVCIAPVCATLAVMVPVAPTTRKSMILVAIGMLMFGIGEILNHPLQTGLRYSENEHSHLRRFFHRHRNPCTLGNLLVILSLLVFFSGLGGFISF